MHFSPRLFAATLALVTSFSAQATAYYGELPTNTPMLAGDFIESGGEYCVLQQGDSNLVVYKRPRSTSCTGGTVIWASYSANATKTIMQSDGNLVQYDDANNYKWASNTGGRAAGNYRFGIHATTGSLNITLWNAAGTSGTTIWSTPADPNPTPPTPPTNPPTNPNPCPSGGSPALYTVCVAAGWQSQFTYRFSACTAQQAQVLAWQNGWTWGACRF
ncbi:MULTISPECIES: hypothetical protein [unclassified Janthinobacterium]|uniref:hypothetical protein n=1 Tax=unclassified Janthinobacterium TaxID=2610881 RepID=UPI0009D9E372|nr:MULTISPECIES: hypothetical protein [unclassified Janthinobacterium]MEC5164266.1 hypothetical protein [Janthinobacterium sp. CG_S6]